MKGTVIGSKLFALASGALFLVASSSTWAQTIEPPFDANYSYVDLGVVPGVPSQLGGLVFTSDSVDAVYIGGYANTSSGFFYRLPLHRDGSGHIDSIAGPGVPAFSGEYNDGGIAYHPESGVIFASRWPVNELGMYKPGSVAPDRIIDLAPFGVASSHSALNFVPAWLPGAAGKFKISTWSGGLFYSVGLSSDGAGTYNVTNVQFETTLPNGPEGFIYVPAGSPNMPNNTMIVSEYSAGSVAVFDIDSNGNPIVGTRRQFISSLSGAEGAAIDPVTGDYLFSTFGGGSRLIVVRGFATPKHVSGHLNLGDYGASAAGVQAVVEVRVAGSTTVLESHTVILGAGGAYDFVTAVAPGNYDVAGKASHWLRSVRPSVVFSATGASGVDFSQVNGDADPDNEVNLADYARLSSAFGSVPGDGNWNPMADFDGDGEVTLADYSTLSRNFGQAGDD